MAQTVTRQELEAKIGQPLGVSDWFLIDQARVNEFADVTLDHQFVHVDVEKAKKTPFGGTIAHGFLTLSLLVHLCLPFIPELANRKLLVNYGFDKIRFVGARQSRQAHSRRRQARRKCRSASPATSSCASTSRSRSKVRTSRRSSPNG